MFVAYSQCKAIPDNYTSIGSDHDLLGNLAKHGLGLSSLELC